MTGFNFFLKIYFSTPPHLNSIGSIIDLGDHHDSNKLGRLHIPSRKAMGLLDLEKIFKGVLTYMGVAAILVLRSGPFE